MNLAAGYFCSEIIQNSEGFFFSSLSCLFPFLVILTARSYLTGVDNINLALDVSLSLCLSITKCIYILKLIFCLD